MNSVRKNQYELELRKLEEMPIHSFRLPELDLSLRGFVTYGYETYPENYVGFDVNYNDEIFVRKYLAEKNPTQSSITPCVYFDIIKLEINAKTKSKDLFGGFVILVQIAKYPDIDGINDIRDLPQLEAAQQHLWEIECGKLSGFRQPNFRTEEISGRQYLVQDVGFENDLPVYLFTLPIDHRHALMIDVTFEGFVPMGSAFPPELHDACMDVVKDFLSHIELSPRD